MNLRRPPCSLLFASVLLAGSASGQTISVTTSADVTDVPLSALIADLPGPDGVVSLREALRASDNELGQQTIGFAIPPEDWYLSDIFPGQVLLQGSFNWSAWDTVIIDGTTQTAFTGDTFAGGHEIVLYGLTLNLNGDSSVLLGIHGSDVTVWGSSCEILNNSGNMDIDLVNGSGSWVHDNEAGTIVIQGSNDNVIVRNVLERVRIWGGGPGNPSRGNRIGGPDVADRNYITGWGNYGEHGFPAGDTIDLYSSEDTLFENNYIGTTPDGMDIGNRASTAGVAIYADNVNLTIRNNLIAIRANHASGGGVYGAAIYMDMFEGGDGIHILGNTLGLNALGEPVLGALHGIWIHGNTMQYGDRVNIGGQGPGEGNVIAGHTESGILMQNNSGIASSAGVRVSGNAIHDNGLIGIDLTPNNWTFGPTPNDALDADTGANALQNYPEISIARVADSVTYVAGTLHSEPLSDYTLEFFASPACDPSGFGQAQLFLGSTSVFADSAGNAVFEAAIPVDTPAGWFVTATATREPVGQTSEFSACVRVRRARTSWWSRQAQGPAPGP